MSSVATVKEPTTGVDRGQLHAYVLDDETRRTIEQVISDLVIPHTSVRRGGVAEAVAELGQRRSPRILLVDVSGSDLPLSQVNELAEVCEPGTTVIVIGDRNDVGLFRDLMAQGVSDYLVKPISSALLQRSVLGASESSGAPRHTTRLGRIVSVVGARGGVGATLIATSCAWAIANRKRRRVALLDLDLQFGSVALHLDLDPSHGLREALENPSRIDGLYLERIMTRHSDTLQVLSAEEKLDETVYVDREALSLLLGELRSRFHFVVVDLPRQMSAATQELLALTTDLVLVSDLSLAGMRDCSRLLQLVPEANASCQITMVANRVGEHRQSGMTAADFRKGIGRTIDHMVPFDPKAVVEALNDGRAVAAGRGSTPAALVAIAEGIVGGAPAAGRGRLASFLRKWRS
ncbi:AAA family ATPase [Marinimicrococcus flavescens]|uniref:AAA family ATPase n=1 Tax=Marinimicrococcus flavescens TaxID=3031815 RepID=A0AAP3XRE4_9PROT|nr:AAA family ATPase [Marinimicrococcus flavescens]